MPKYHVVITGSRPEKGTDKKYLPLPSENVEFINATLAKLASSDYVAIYHGMAAGVDTVANEYAFANGIHVKQFPAYWFNPSKADNTDRGAGLFRNEQMVRHAKDAVYGKHDEVVVLLAFTNKPLAESKGTAHCVEFAKGRSVEVRTFELPIKAASKTQATEPVSNPF